MSFKRSVQRNHKVELTHHKDEQKNQIKSNFNFTWIPFDYKSFFILAVIFVFSQFLCVPLIAQFFNYAFALVLTHGMISSLLVVISFWAIAQEKPTLSASLVRLSFCILMFGGFSLALVLLFKL